MAYAVFSSPRFPLVFGALSAAIPEMLFDAVGSITRQEWRRTGSGDHWDTVLLAGVVVFNQ